MRAGRRAPAANSRNSNGSCTNGFLCGPWPRAPRSKEPRRRAATSLCRPAPEMPRPLALSHGAGGFRAKFKPGSEIRVEGIHAMPLRRALPRPAPLRERILMAERPRPARPGLAGTWPTPKFEALADEAAPGCAVEALKARRRGRPMLGTARPTSSLSGATRPQVAGGSAVPNPSKRPPGTSKSHSRHDSSNAEGPGGFPPGPSALPRKRGRSVVRLTDRHTPPNRRRVMRRGPLWWCPSEPRLHRPRRRPPSLPCRP